MKHFHPPKLGACLDPSCKPSGVTELFEPTDAETFAAHEHDGIPVTAPYDPPMSSLCTFLRNHKGCKMLVSGVGGFTISCLVHEEQH